MSELNGMVYIGFKNKKQLAAFHRYFDFDTRPMFTVLVKPHKTHLLWTTRTQLESNHSQNTNTAPDKTGSASSLSTNTLSISLLILAE